MIPDDRRYLITHEWHQPQGDLVTIGITQFAADELTDITYVSLPKVGTQLKANSRFGEIESVKATSDLYSGISGEVVEVNDALTKDPAAVNRDPFTEGWMLKLRPSDKGELEKLLDAATYKSKSGH